jgi:hypothetical protein
MHLTQRDLNEQGERFWSDVNAKFQLTITRNPSILQEALADLQADSVRYPVYFQRSLEQAVFDAKDKRELHQREFALKGVYAREADPLSSFIAEIVKQKPRITAPELLQYLKDTAPIPPIAEVDNDEIQLSNGKVVPVSGLKDRLYRAKKKNKSRNR